MSLNTLGKVVVTTAGTIVQATTTKLNCNGVFFQADPANVGEIFIGNASLVASTRVGCFAILAKPTSATTGPFDRWLAQSVFLGAIALNNIWFDASSSGDGVIVAYI